jgi:hypothetical protein
VKGNLVVDAMADTVVDPAGKALGRVGVCLPTTAVSDRLVDAVVAQGDSTSIAATVSEHLAAGADHVTLLASIGDEFTVGVDQLEELAPALADLD